MTTLAKYPIIFQLLILANLSGDERPCQRCIKRGLQDACHDGVRKKAKYLHDAPNEALMPGAATSFQHPMVNTTNIPHTPSSAGMDPSSAISNHGQFLPPTPQNAPPGFGIYPQDNLQGQMPPPLQDVSMKATYATSQPNLSPTLNTRGSQQASPLQTMSGGIPQSSSAQQDPVQNTFGGPFFDPSDPALFNFDLANLNFGSQYGALEFGMLGHMALGAQATGPNDSGYVTQPHTAASFTASTAGSTGYSPSPGGANNAMYPQDAVMAEGWTAGPDADAQGGNVHGQNGNVGSSQPGASNIPHTYTITAGPPSWTSASPPAPSPQELGSGFENNPIGATFYPNKKRYHHLTTTAANVKPPTAKCPRQAITRPLRHLLHRQRTLLLHQRLPRPRALSPTALLRAKDPTRRQSPRIHPPVLHRMHENAQP